MKVNNYENQELTNISRLWWACRRGMLELDVILQSFLKEAFPRLTEGDKMAFAKLLHCNDMELYSWLITYSSAPDKENENIVIKIKDHVRRRVSS